jgi:hypothetical protein
MTWRLQSPVALLIFNRPEPTTEVISRIAEAKPQKLLVVADGPRADRQGEAERCAAARKAVLERINWQCEVLTDFSDQNVGCRKRVSSGLDWVFTQVDSAIVLEDDCLPDPTLFRFFDEMLTRYRDDERIMMISGFNPIADGWKANTQQYHFSYCGSIWGWASWRRAWKHYDVNMKLWGSDEIRNRIKDILADPRLYESRLALYDKVHRGEIDTWDFQWSFARLIQSGLSVVPSRNLVSNIGFGSDATHTKRGSAAVDSAATHAMTFPIRFHDYVAVDREYDLEFTRVISGSK